MTGIVVAVATARIKSTSYPSPVPSRSMLCRRISPAPRDSTSRAQATGSSPVGVCPPSTRTSQRPSAPRRTSILTTTPDCRSGSRASVMSSGVRKAAVLSVILSAPRRKIAAHLLHGRDAAAPRQRHEARLADGIQNRQWIGESLGLVIVTPQVVVVVAGDVEIDQFIDVPLVEPLDFIDRRANDLVNLE